MKHIFISHEKSDADFARVLIIELEKAGFSTWVDHDRLYGGDDWRAEIDQAIRDASVLIVVMTPEARQSEYVTYEWAFALGVGVTVIPVMLRDTTLHPRLAILQYLNFTNLKVRPWSELIEAVKKATNIPDTSTEDSVQNIPVFIIEATKALNRANRPERREAVKSLALANHPAARDALIEALRHPIKDVRIYAALVLLQFDDLVIQAIPTLLDIQYDEDTELYRQVMEALLQTGSNAVPGLLEALHNGNKVMRRNAARILGQIGNLDATPGLLAALKDEDVEVRRNAAMALRDIKSSDAVSGLLAALKDVDVDVRRGAAFALIPIGTFEAIPALIEALQDENADVRRLIALVLSRIGQEAVPGLRKA